MIPIQASEQRVLDECLLLMAELGFQGIVIPAAVDMDLVRIGVQQVDDRRTSHPQCIVTAEYDHALTIQVTCPVGVIPAATIEELARINGNDDPSIIPEELWNWQILSIEADRDLENSPQWGRILRRGKGISTVLVVLDSPGFKALVSDPDKLRLTVRSAIRIIPRPS